jgi:hypothetical protein
MTDGVRTYRKRPVVVAAMRFTGSPNNRDALEAWGVKLKMMPHEGTIVTALWVQANKTWLPLDVGEYIIQDKLGFYPCKESTFDETYEQIED